MKVRYSYRVYPTSMQQRALAQLFGCVRTVWNDSLALCRLSSKLPKTSALQKLFITLAKKTQDRAWLKSEETSEGSHRNVGVGHTHDRINKCSQRTHKTATVAMSVEARTRKVEWEQLSLPI